MLFSATMSEQVDALNVELTANEEDLQQASAAMNQWRTQWEEELTEKNSIDAELLTLRSEFEKSSATYDREIEGLKELLEKERTLRDEMNTAFNSEEGELAQYGEKLDSQKAELEKLAGGAGGDLFVLLQNEGADGYVEHRIGRYGRSLDKAQGSQAMTKLQQTTSDGTLVQTMAKLLHVTAL